MNGTLRRRVSLGGRLARGVALLGVCVAAVASPLAAQACTTPNTPAYPHACTNANTLTWTVPALLSVNLSAQTAIGAVTITDFVAGNRVAQGPTLTVRRNRPYAATIQRLAGVWTAGGGGNPAKPVSDLAWGTSAGGPWTTMATTPATVIASAIGGTGVTPTVIWYRVNLGGVDWPGTYRLALRITVSAP